MRERLLPIVLLLLPACDALSKLGESESSSSCKAGTEKCECHETGMCDGGLECLSQLCVRPATQKSGSANADFLVDLVCACKRDADTSTCARVARWGTAVINGKQAEPDTKSFDLPGKTAERIEQCLGAPVTAKAEPGDDTIAVVEGWADKICACKDMECVKLVQVEQETWVKEHASSLSGPDADPKKIEAATKRMTECLTKMMTAEAGGW